MPKTALLLMSIFVFPNLGALVQNHKGQTESVMQSSVACSDSSTILPAKRTPEVCAESDFALYGRPVMFPLRNGIAYGVSVAPDKPASVTIWMDNQTEKPESFGFCCNATFVGFISVYDQKGQRIPSKREIANAKAQAGDIASLPGCSCSGFGTVPPHSLKVIDHGDVSTGYDLAPGRYTIVEYPPRINAAPGPPPSPTLPPTGPRLAISLP